MSRPATRLGDVLNSAYELLELESSSDKLEVYRAEDRRTHAKVRVKLLRPEYALQTQVVDGFLRGPRSLALVSHVSLPRVRVDTDDIGIPFVVEEEVEGRTLAGLIGSFPQGVPMELMRQLCVPLIEALALAHAHGFVHGRIDPEHVKLLGSISALEPKWIGLGADADEPLPQAANFRAPELERSSQPSAHADVFALGVLLYNMLTGELPFRSGKDSAVPLDEIAPHLSPAWKELTAACLAARPKQRPPDAGVVLHRLRSCLSFPPTATVRAKPDADKTVAANARAKASPSPHPQPLEPTRNDTAKPSGPAPTVRRDERPVADRARRSPAPPAAEARASTSPRDKKVAAQDAAEKLSAKHKPTAAEPEQHASRPARSRSPTPQPPSQSGPPLEAFEVKSPRLAAAARGAPAGLSAAQLEGLRRLRGKEDERGNRWLALLCVLFFLVLLQVALPLLMEPDFATAHATFGADVKIAAGVFSVVSVVGAIRAFIVQAQRKTIIHRVSSFILTVVMICVLVLAATHFSGSFALGAAAGVARRALPWALGFWFLWMTLGLGARGVRRLGSDVAFAMLLLLMAAGSSFGSYRAVTAAIRGERERASHAVPSLEQRLRERVAPGRQSGTGDEPLRERTEIGASEEDDLKPVEDLQQQRLEDQRAIDEVQRGVGSQRPPASTTGR